MYSKIRLSTLNVSIHRGFVSFTKEVLFMEVHWVLLPVFNKDVYITKNCKN